MPVELADAKSDGLRSIAADVRDETIEWDPAHEDIHMNVEMELTRRIGAVAGKLHTGRSRNDQVATDLRLYLRRRIGDIERALLNVERALVSLADDHRDADGLAAPGAASPEKRGARPNPRCAPKPRRPSAG